MNHFHELRQRLVDCRAQLRSSKDLYELIKAEATERAAPQGKNADERAVALILALARDAAYQTALGSFRRDETEVERVEALLEAARDERRAAEWQIRAKLADGLFRASVPGEQADDEAFDDVVDAAIDDELDPDPDTDYQAERYSSSYSATLRRQYPRNGTEETEEFPF
jgi:hypothetical protein